MEVKEQCKSCFHFQVCANVLKQQLFAREIMLKEENPKCEHYIPTADVVPVVRCARCKHYNTFNCADGFGWCEHFNRGEMDEHYCSYGERKDEG